jgi:hypothetical protein
MGINMEPCLVVLGICIPYILLMALLISKTRQIRKNHEKWIQKSQADFDEFIRKWDELQKK